MINPGGMLTITDLIDNYLKYAERTFKFTRSGGINPHYRRLLLVIGLMEKHRPNPIHKFGPDELAIAQEWRTPSQAGILSLAKGVSHDRIKRSTDRIDLISLIHLVRLADLSVNGCRPSRS